MAPRIWQRFASTSARRRIAGPAAIFWKLQWSGRGGQHAVPAAFASSDFRPQFQGLHVHRRARPKQAHSLSVCVRVGKEDAGVERDPEAVVLT
jgi:hypothetical protein